MGDFAVDNRASFGQYWGQHFFFNLCLRPHQIRAEQFQTCMLIYRQCLRKEVYFFWHSETIENYIQNFRLFSPPKIRFSKIRENYYSKFSLLSYQKFASKKQCEITTKNLRYFSYQKINV